MSANNAIFTTMGMFIIDEIHFPQSSNQKSYFDVIGGGGTFGAMGSRVIATKKYSDKVGFIVDKGSDFPVEIEKYLNDWHIGIVWRSDPSRLTTRGWNMYGDNELRGGFLLI